MKTKKYLLKSWLIVHLSIAFSNSWGQQRVLTGSVTDAKTNEPVAFAVVYINNTSIATETNETGKYILKNAFNHAQGGSVEIVVSSVGYTTIRQKVVDSQQDTLIFNFSLQNAPQNTIAEVSVKGKRDKQWERQYSQFEDVFLGANNNARNAKILNPWVVDFSGEAYEFTATAQKILEVENKALGYKIYFELQRFSLSSTRNSLAGLARFEEIKPTDQKQKRKINQQRQATYEGSERHFFRALSRNNLKKEGFVVYKVDPNYREKTSFSHLNPQLGKRLFSFNDTLAVRPGRFPTSKEIIIPYELEILNINSIRRVGSYQDAPFAVSWLSVRGGKVEVTNTGLLYDTNVCEWAGDIAQRRIADMLPLDFDPAPLAENENSKLLLPKNTQPPQVVFEPIAAPLVVVKHHFEGDSTVFQIQVKKSNGKPVKGRFSVAIVEDIQVKNQQPVRTTDTTLISKTVADIDTTTFKTDKKSITLEEVKVKTSRTTKTAQSMVGKVDYVVDNEKLKDIISGNIITAIQGKVPGVEVYETIDGSGYTKRGIRIRGANNTFQKKSAVEDEPLFLVDGIPFGTLENLNAIPISEVWQIEVIKRANSLLGSRGYNGAINIVTKRAINKSLAPSSAGSNANKFFFWQPSTVLSPQGEAVVRFALPRGIRYLVTINGTTSENQPFTHEIKVY